MRPIVKQGRGGHHLTRAHTNPPQTASQATNRWKRFGPYKDEVMQSLLAEQYHLCCYSELRADQEGLSHHIEHVENKSQNPERTFDYENLAACGLTSTDDLPAFAIQGYETFGGHAPGKRKAVDMALFVSCHQPDSQRYFAYLSDGRVVPASALDTQQQARAQYTIDLLNLNSPYLMVRRQRWWDELDAYYEEHASQNWSMAHLASVDLLPAHGKLSRFFSLTRQFFGPAAEQALTNWAPQLA